MRADFKGGGRPPPQEKCLVLNRLQAIGNHTSGVGGWGGDDPRIPSSFC